MQSVGFGFNRVQSRRSEHKGKYVGMCCGLRDRTSRNNRSVRP